MTAEKEKRVGIAEGDALACDRCKLKPAEIFQINGEYCVECWQTITHTNT